MRWKYARKTALPWIIFLSKKLRTILLKSIFLKNQRPESAWKFWLIGIFVVISGWNVTICILHMWKIGVRAFLEYVVNFVIFDFFAKSGYFDSAGYDTRFRFEFRTPSSDKILKFKSLLSFLVTFLLRALDKMLKMRSPQ